MTKIIKSGYLLALITALFIVSAATSVTAVLIRFEGTVVINGTNFTANGAPVSVHINNSNTTVRTKFVGQNESSQETIASGYFIIDLSCQQTENITFRVYNITANGSTPQVCNSSTLFVQGMTLYFNKTPNSEPCYYNLGCTSNFCVHNVCRASSTFCGDGFCDSGETNATCSADCPTPSPSPGPSPGPGAPGPEEPKNASQRPVLVPGVGLINNTKLLAAIEKVLAKGTLSDQARENLLRLSASIVSDIETTRSIDTSATESTIKTTMKYKGTKKVKNFIVYEKIPKTFAQTASKITVSAPSGTIEVVEADPEYVIKYSEISPNQEITITYKVAEKVATTVINSMVTEVYAESLEDIVTAPPVICNAGDKRCSGNNLETCNQDGTAWAVSEACDYGCENNACKAKPAEAAVDYTPIVIAAIVIAIVAAFGVYYAMGYRKKKSFAPKLR